jgi:hypothetical protein
MHRFRALGQVKSSSRHKIATRASLHRAAVVVQGAAIPCHALGKSPFSFVGNRQRSADSREKFTGMCRA